MIDEFLTVSLYQPNEFISRDLYVVRQHVVLCEVKWQEAKGGSRNMDWARGGMFKGLGQFPVTA